MLIRLKRLSMRLWFRAVLFVFFYLLAAQVSYQVSFQGASFSSVWLPSGLFIAVLLLSPVQDWAAYLLAALPAALLSGGLHHQPLGFSLLLYVSEVLEAVTGACFVRRFNERPGQFKTPRDVLILILFAMLASPMLSALINATTIAAVKNGFNFWAAWRIAWIGHGLGVLVVTPLILAWVDFRPSLRGNSPERLLELAVLFTALIICALYTFVGVPGQNRLNYLVVPCIVWVALRFGPRGTTLSGLIVTLMATWGIKLQLDAFAYSDITIAPNVDSVSGFLSIVLITGYLLTTILDEGKRTDKALRDSEERYRMLVENQAEGVATVDPHEVFTFANPSALQIFGVDELVGHSLKEFTTPAQFNMLLRQTQQRQTGVKNRYELEITQPNGKRCNLLVNATPQYDSHGQWSGAFAVFHDETERKQAEIALRDSRARFKTLFEHSPIPIWEEDFSRIKMLIDSLRRDGITDFQAYFRQHPEQVHICAQLIHILDVNHAVLQQFNCTDKNQFMSQVNTLAQRGPDDIFIAELAAIAEGKTEFDMEGPNDLVDGIVRYHHVRWAVAPGYEQDYRRVIVSLIDITDRWEAEERLRYLSTHDVLTGLYNRNFFEGELERLENCNAEPVNVIVVDVNGMKSTNDTFGHAAGDDLLRRTSQVLRMSFPKEDVIARIGGDEFVILFQGLTPVQEAVARVKRYQAEHNQRFNGAPLSLAIGAASAGNESSMVDLLRKADQQMYREKLRINKHRTLAKSEGKSGINPGNSPQEN